MLWLPVKMNCFPLGKADVVILAAVFRKQMRSRNKNSGDQRDRSFERKDNDKMQNKTRCMQIMSLLMFS